MTQRDLNRAVANATGETVDMIERMGFGPLTETPIEREPQMVDWDEHIELRGALRFQPQSVDCDSEQLI